MELCMSQKERDRLRVLHDLCERRLRQREAGALMDLSVRQVRRILKRYKALGDAGMVRRLRNRKSNRKIPTPGDAPWPECAGFGGHLAA